MENALLRARLAQMLNDFPAQSALHAVDLSTGETIASIRAEAQMTSASTIKTPILLCALTEVEAGRLYTRSRVLPSPRRTSARIPKCSRRNTVRTAALCGKCSIG